MEAQRPPVAGRSPPGRALRTGTVTDRIFSPLFNNSEKQYKDKCNKFAFLNKMTDPLEVPEHLRAIARDELGETPEVRARALQELRTRIAALPESDRLADVSDQNLIRFLRCRKYDMEKALQSTVDLQKFNSLHPEWVDNLRADEFQIFSTFFQVLEHRGPRGQFIVVLRPNNGIKVFTPEFIAENPLAMIRCNIFFLDRLRKSIEVQICGVIVCNSFKGFSVGDNLRLSKASKVNEQIATFMF